jgi:hypothetical protein
MRSVVSRVLSCDDVTRPMEPMSECSAHLGGGTAAAAEPVGQSPLALPVPVAGRSTGPPVAAAHLANRPLARPPANGARWAPAHPRVIQVVRAPVPGLRRCRSAARVGRAGWHWHHRRAPFWARRPSRAWPRGPGETNLKFRVAAAFELRLGNLTARRAVSTLQVVAAPTGTQTAFCSLSGLVSSGP